jgi:hypothetical protein
MVESVSPFLMRKAVRQIEFVRIVAVLLVCLQADACAAAETVGCKPPAGKTECEKGKPAKQRRAVPQQLEPRATPPAAPVQQHQPPPPAPQSAVPPTAPSPVTTCDAGGCWNSGASRYNGGAGGTYLDNSGRLCQRQGAWMQCF